MDDIRRAARRLADEVLFPDATRVDGMDAIPESHFDALAGAGLFGASAPVAAGGLGLGLSAMCAVTEELASGCLATAFVWIQHFRLLRTLTDGWPPGKGEWLAAACQGKLRGGVALAGLIPGPPMLRATPVEGGWRLDGTAPWVTGWGQLDLLIVAARGPAETLVTLVLDAAPATGLTMSRQRLVAANASGTVRLDFDAVTVPGDRFVSQVPFDPRQPGMLRLNGSLALGVALRCCRLLGAGPLDDELAACRAQLDFAVTADTTAPAAGPGQINAAAAGPGQINAAAAGPGQINAAATARAAACVLALRAAAALAVHNGSKSATAGHHAERINREALFLLVFGSRPAIKAALLRQLGATPTALLQL
jgi:alkylation response protein AidB-like acyl-CoA dehydrogenase